MISSPSPTLHCSGHCSPSFRSHCKCYYKLPFLQSSVSTAHRQRHSPSIIPAPPFPRISATESAWGSGKTLGASGEDDDAEPKKQIVDTSTQYSLPRTSADSLAAAQMPGTQTKTVCSALTLPWAKRSTSDVAKPIAYTSAKNGTFKSEDKAVRLLKRAGPKDPSI